MEKEKRLKEPMGGLIHDAVVSMNHGGDDQKPVNVVADKSKLDVGSNGGVEIEGYVKWFSELSNKDVAIVGGKGASLSEMFVSGFPVPPGIVITAQAFEYFIKEARLNEKIKAIIDAVDVDDTEKLTQASKEIRKLIEGAKIPKELGDEILEEYHILGSEEIDEQKVSEDALNILKNSQEPIFVSVRSSATTEDLAEASFAGQQESFLNVKGDQELLKHVKKCFSSLYTPRAIYYRNKKGFKEGDSLLAVVIQKMVDSEKSGVVFSKDPMNVSDDIAVEAVYGLGEGIVSGKIRPDHYVVSKELEIKKVNVADKKIAIVRTSSGQNEIVRLSPEKSKSQVLTSGEILEIANYATKLEEHYKKPQDIEFAIEAKKVYIVQSRPITTLKEGVEKKGEALSGNVLLEGLGSSPGIGIGTVRVIHSMEELSKIKKGDILVTEMTNPDMVVSMQKSAAIVTDEGGMTAHASIVSREMGIPAVVGTEDATSVLKDGMKITVDGYHGKVYEGEVAKAQTAEIKPAVPTKEIKLKVIVDLPEFAERAVKAEIDSVGLTRIEGIIANSKKHPLLYEKEDNLEEYVELLKKGIEGILEHFRCMWIRTSDIRTDEYGSLEGAPEREINPMLGMHGIRFSLLHPKILEAELQAVKEVVEKNPGKKIGVMFPQVITIEEVRKAKEYFNKYKVEGMEFGAMIETPASVQIIDDICKEVDFISFGTNDLTQYTLAVDRGEDSVKELYNELHPAIFAQIEKVIESCKEHDVESSICGQAGSKREMAEFLFEKGIDSISVNADAAFDISNVIKELEDKLYAERERQDKEREEEERREREREEREREYHERREREDREREEKERLDRERVEEERREREERERVEREDREREEKEREERREMEEREEKERGEEKLKSEGDGGGNDYEKLEEVDDSEKLEEVKEDFREEQLGVQDENVQELDELKKKFYNEESGQFDKKGWKKFKRKWKKKMNKKGNVDSGLGEIKKEIDDLDEGRFLKEDSIQVPAEIHDVGESKDDDVEGVENIEPIGEVDRIEEKVEDIQEKAMQENMEELEKIDRGFESEVEKVDDSGGGGEDGDSRGDGDSGGDGGGGMDDSFEDESVGVYNPNEEPKKRPVYKYNFDDYE